MPLDIEQLRANADAAGQLLKTLANPDRLLLLDVMRGEAGKGAADVAALVFAFDRLVTAHVGIVNLSLAGPDHPALQRAVSQSQKSGMIVVAAVGNDGPAAPPAFPAAYEGVVNVSSAYGYYIDFNRADGIADKPALFQADALHPTAEAQGAILDTVWKVVGNLVNQLLCDLLAFSALKLHCVHELISSNSRLVVS